MRSAMSQLENIVTAYNSDASGSSDESTVIGTCKWYHDYTGYTYNDGRCFNNRWSPDEDCEHFLEYQAKLTVSAFS